MCHPSKSRLVAFCLAAWVGVGWSLGSRGQQAPLDESPTSQSVYDVEPQHLWNRLHDTFFIRVGPDGRAYGQDRLEPLLWTSSRHLLVEASHKRAIALLEEFLNDNGEKWIEDPLKRALLQRDLWLVFNWLEGYRGVFAEPAIKPEVARAAQERLRRPLAAVIGRLALSPKKIQNLPDNYAAAVASGQFARRIDPEQPGKPYLPPDLFVADGPWVCVGRTDGHTAPQHLQEGGGNHFTNSVFLVFLRLPSGRAATAEYLKQLCCFDQPLLVRNPEDANRLPFVPNQQLPQFPKGTELALVRRAMLIDSSHRVVVSPLTESVQLRVFHGEIPALTRQVLHDSENLRAFDALGRNSETRRRVGSWLSFHEFRLSRTQLLADRAGGLRAVDSEERDFKTGFNAHPWDEFERRLPTDQSFAKSRRRTIKETCFACHSLPGVYSFQSLQHLRSGMEGAGDKLSPFPLSEMPISAVAGAAVKWKQGRPNWISLQKLLAE